MPELDGGQSVSTKSPEACLAFHRSSVYHDGYGMPSLAKKFCGASAR